MLAAVLLLSGSAGSSAQQPAGQGPSYPAPQYYAGLTLMRAGAMREAGEAFAAAVGRSRKTPRGRWVDAIPGLAMQGEAAYQLGNLPLARQQWELALKLAIQHEDSLGAVQWPAQFPPAAAARGDLPVWARGAGAAVLQVPERLIIAVGELNPGRVLRSGGTFVPRQNVRVDVVEVIRCLGWACYRRAELLGPLGEDDPLFPAVEQLARRLRTNAPPAGAPLWATVQRLAAFGYQTAQPGGGGPDAGVGSGRAHPLTPLALLHAARVALRGQRFDAMRSPLGRCAPIAAAFGHQEAIAEAMRLGGGTLLASGPNELLPLAAAIAETGERETALAALSAELLIAEAALANNDPAAAAQRLQRVRRWLERRETSLPRTAAWAAWIRAGWHATRGEPRAAITSLQEITQFVVARRAGPSQYQRAQARRLLQTEASQQAAERLVRLLPPPDDVAWAWDATDAVGRLYAARSADWQLLIEAALARGDERALLAHFDSLLADAFRTRLPLGGRLLDVRWWLAKRAEPLGGDAARQRTRLVQRFPAAAQSVQSLTPLRKDFLRIDPWSDDADGQRRAKEVIASYTSAVAAAERVCQIAALRRGHVPRRFPRRLDPAGELPRLAGEQSVLCFLTLGRRWWGMLWHGDQIDVWPIEGGATNATSLRNWVQSIGVGRRRAGGQQLPTDDQWKDEAVGIRQKLLPPGSLDHVRTERLVVVPMGVLWNFPIGALPSDDRDSPPLQQRFELTFAPTPSLAVTPEPEEPAGRECILTGGRFFAPRDAQLERDELNKLREQASEPRQLRTMSVPVPGELLAARLRCLCVADAVTPPERPLQLTLLAPGGSARGGAPLRQPISLVDWLALPLQAPQTVLLPGLRPDLNSDGSDLFLIAMGLKACGVRQALLARWAVGGPSSATLLRETLKELETVGLPRAWQRASQILAGELLDPNLEPLLSAGDRKASQIPGDQPLLRAGYLLLH